MPGLTFNSLPEYEESIVSLIGYANLGISLLIFSVLAIRRILDVDRKWISGFVIVAGDVYKRQIMRFICIIRVLIVPCIGERRGYCGLSE